MGAAAVEARRQIPPPGSAVIRAVFDTNIIVSIALPNSRLQPIQAGWRAGRCRLLVSQAIFDEYLRVLTYPKFHLTTEEVTRLIEREVLPHADFVRVHTHVEVVEKDPSDNKFLACAVDGQAACLVSGDPHLLDLKNFRGIPIVTGREFIARLSTS